MYFVEALYHNGIPKIPHDFGYIAGQNRIARADLYLLFSVNERRAVPTVGMKTPDYLYDFFVKNEEMGILSVSLANGDLLSEVEVIPENRIVPVVGKDIRNIEKIFALFLCLTKAEFDVLFEVK